MKASIKQLTIAIVFLLYASIGYACEWESLSFEDRVLNGKASEDHYKEYTQIFYSKIGPQTQVAMKKCASKGEALDQNSFTLVADITAEGKPVAIDTDPKGKVSLCFSEAFKDFSFPLPANNTREGLYPITIEMKIE